MRANGKAPARPRPDRKPARLALDRAGLARNLPMDMPPDFAETFPVPKGSEPVSARPNVVGDHAPSALATCARICPLRSLGISWRLRAIAEPVHLASRSDWSRTRPKVPQPCVPKRAEAEGTQSCVPRRWPCEIDVVVAAALSPKPRGETVPTCVRREPPRFARVVRVDRTRRPGRRLTRQEGRSSNGGWRLHVACGYALARIAGAGPRSRAPVRNGTLLTGGALRFA